MFAITNQGTTNYTSVPTITITPTPATAGVGMRATCTLTAGKVTSITLLSKGYGSNNTHNMHCASMLNNMHINMRSICTICIICIFENTQNMQYNMQYNM